MTYRQPTCLRGCQSGLDYINLKGSGTSGQSSSYCKPYNQCVFIPLLFHGNHFAMATIRTDDKQAVTSSEMSLDSSSRDTAWKYLEIHDTVVHEDPRHLKVLRRRIDWRVLPLAFLCYTMQFLDKVLINVSCCLSESNSVLTECVVRCGHGLTQRLGAQGQQLLQCCYRVLHRLSDRRGA